MQTSSENLKNKLKEEVKTAHREGMRSIERIVQNCYLFHGPYFRINEIQYAELYLSRVNPTDETYAEIADELTKVSRLTKRMLKEYKERELEDLKELRNASREPLKELAQHAKDAKDAVDTLAMMEG